MITLIGRGALSLAPWTLLSSTSTNANIATALANKPRIIIIPTSRSDAEPRWDGIKCLIFPHSARKRPSFAGGKVEPSLGIASARKHHHFPAKQSEISLRWTKRDFA